MTVLKQLYEYHRMKKSGEFPERRIEVTLDGKIIDTLRQRDRFGNECVVRAMRILEPHKAFREPLDDALQAVEDMQ